MCCLQYLAKFNDFSCPTHARAPCHAKSSTNLLQLNNGVVPADIADSKRHDPDSSYIVKGFALDRFAIFGNQ